MHQIAQERLKKSEQRYSISKIHRIGQSLLYQKNKSLTQISLQGILDTANRELEVFADHFTPMPARKIGLEGKQSKYFSIKLE